MNLPTVADLEPVAFRQFRDETGVLVPIELVRFVPFTIVRLFWIRDVPAGGIRGGHAHKACNQYLICAVGSVSVEANDGSRERTIALPAGLALHIPPAIFTTERFDAPGTVVTVLCDRPYEASDYLNDRAALIDFRSKEHG